MRLIMTWQISEIVSRAHEEAHDAGILSGSMKLTFSRGKKKSDFYSDGLLLKGQDRLDSAG